MNHLKGIVSYFFMFPAIVIGTLTMMSYGVPSSIWIQNITIWIVGTVLGSVGTICLERLRLLFHQANQPIIPTSPSKALSLFTLKTNCFVSLFTMDMLKYHTVYIWQVS